VALLPQLKLSWGVACGPAERVEPALARLALIADSFLSVATPVQLSLPRLLAAAPALQARVRARTAGNLAALRSALARGAASVLDAEGGWSAVLRLPRARGSRRRGLGGRAAGRRRAGPAGLALRPRRLSRGCVALVRAGAFRGGVALLAREVARRAG